MSDQEHKSKKPKIEAADIVATNTPKLYLDSRQWLEWYADTHAEKSPISLKWYLPGGRKCDYHLIYERDRRSCGREPASLEVFLRAWRCETPWIVIPKHLGKFLKCALCEWLKLQIDKTPRTQHPDVADGTDVADVASSSVADADVVVM